MPIYLHPGPLPAAVRVAYFSGLEPAVAGALSTFGWGWDAECGMHVLRMVVSGVFERHPGLQLTYSDSASATAFLRDAPLTPADRAKIAHTNAERLLRL